MVGGIDQPDDNVTSDLLYHEFVWNDFIQVVAARSVLVIFWNPKSSRITLTEEKLIKFKSPITYLITEIPKSMV